MACSSNTSSRSASRRCRRAHRNSRRSRVQRFKGSRTSMVGIASYGAYIPMLRLPLAAITGGGRKASASGGEKAVANFDEDSVTMAVAAGVNCLEGIDRDTVDGVL